MSACRRIQHYSGTKSNVIREMIENKNKGRMDEKAGDIAKRNSKLMELCEKWKIHKENHKQAEIRFREIEKEIEKLSHELKLDPSFPNYSYDKSKDVKFYYSHNECFIPEKTLKELELADHLNALCKRKKANEVWDRVIAEYKLVEV